MLGSGMKSRMKSQRPRNELEKFSTQPRTMCPRSLTSQLPQVLRRGVFPSFACCGVSTLLIWPREHRGVLTHSCRFLGIAPASRMSSARRLGFFLRGTSLHMKLPLFVVYEVAAIDLSVDRALRADCGSYPVDWQRFPGRHLDTHQ
jgi:hypothetical protein